MPAPKGNKNGAVAWFGSASDEKPVKKYVRLTEELDKQVLELLANDETFSDFARAAIEKEVKRRKDKN